MEIERHLYYGRGTTSQKYETLKLPAGNVSFENFVGQIIDHASNFKGWNYLWSNSLSCWEF